MTRGLPQTPVIELVASIQAGNKNAEQELYERYRRGIAMILRETLGSRAVAEDLFQETFRLSIQKIRRGELLDPNRLPQFLNSLARNLAIDYFRKKNRRPAEEGLDNVEVEFEIAPTQYVQLENQEKGRLALEVLRQLGNDRYREVLYRYYIAEEEKQSICRDLDLSSLHFNRVLYRARQHYRDLFLRVVARQDQRLKDTE